MVANFRRASGGGGCFFSFAVFGDETLLVGGFGRSWDVVFAIGFALDDALSIQHASVIAAAERQCASDGFEGILKICNHNE